MIARNVCTVIKARSRDRSPFLYCNASIREELMACTCLIRDVTKYLSSELVLLHVSVANNFSQRTSHSLYDAIRLASPFV